MDDRLRAIIACSLLPGMGSQRIRTLLNTLSHPMEAFSLSDKEWDAIPGFGGKLRTLFQEFDKWALVDSTLEKAAKLELILIPYTSVDYPSRLRHIYDAPVLLWGKGELSCLHGDGLAVVGTRNPSAYGKKMAEYVATSAAQAGLTVVSGLAYGVDTIAHKAAVELNKPTIAVLGSGLDWIYPAANKPLVQDIIATGGMVLTEFPPGTKPDAGNFPVRNRIVSGMTLGTVVIETALEGGSRITARLALEQGREVFAVPHSLENERGMGCNELIKKGEAKLIQTFQDVWDEVKDMVADTESRPVHLEDAPTLPDWQQAELDETAKKICALLEEKRRHIDELVVLAGMDSSQLLVHLLDLEFAGLVRQLAGKHFELAQ